MSNMACYNRTGFVETQLLYKKYSLELSFTILLWVKNENHGFIYFLPRVCRSCDARGPLPRIPSRRWVKQKHESHISKNIKLTGYDRNLIISFKNRDPVSINSYSAVLITKLWLVRSITTRRWLQAKASLLVSCSFSTWSWYGFSEANYGVPFFESFVLWDEPSRPTKQARPIDQ